MLRQKKGPRHYHAAGTSSPGTASGSKMQYTRILPNPGLAVVGEHWFAGRGRFLRGEHSRPWYRPVSAAHVVPGWLHGCMGCVPAAFVLSISLIGMRDWAFAALR